MQVIHENAAMQTLALAQRRQGRRIGFVPTMGALHAGHRALIEQARRLCDWLVVSVFVNPTQFGPGEDFAAYPRTLEPDRQLCEAAGTDVLFVPDAAGMYAPDHSVYVEESALSGGLCGARRPGHFRGVTTVVCKLFNLVQPDVAVFGEKDAQQLRVIERMVRDLNLPVRIVRGPTVREPDGLAMSSRNRYLGVDARRQALCLRAALDAARDRHAAGERNADALLAAMHAVLARYPLAKVDYAAVVDEKTLAPVARIERPVLVALAVRVDGTRLIDNMVLGT